MSNPQVYNRYMRILSDKLKSITWQQWILVAMLLLAIGSMLSALQNKNPKPSPGVFTTAPSLVASHDKTLRTISYIKVISKAEAKKRGNLPPEVEADEDLEIIEEATIPPSENGSVVVATVNTTTGDSAINYKEKEAPLFAFVNKRRVGVGYGISTQGTEARVFGEWTFARSGNTYLSGYGEINTKAWDAPEAKALLLIDNRW